MAQAVTALNLLLTALPPDQRFELVLEVFRRRPQSVRVPSEVAFYLARRSESLFTETQVHELERVCRDLYRASWERGDLVKHPRFLGMLPDWLGRQEPRTDAAEIIRATLSSDDARFLELLGRYENVQFDRFEPDRFNTKYLTQIYTLEELLERLESIRDNPALEQQRPRVEELIAEVQRQLEGGDVQPQPFLPVPPQGAPPAMNLPIEE